MFFERLFSVTQFLILKFLPRFFLYFFLLVSFSLITALIAYHLFFEGKIYQGVFVGGLDLSGKSVAEAEKILNQSFSDFSKIVLQDKDKEWFLDPSSIDLNFNSGATALKAYSYGRKGRLLLDLWNQWEALKNKKTIEAVYSFNGVSLNNFLEQIAKSFDKPAENSRLVSENGEFVATPSKNGQELDRELTIALLRENWVYLEKKNIVLPIKELKPLVSQQEIQAKKELILGLAKKPLILKTAQKTWTLEGAKVLELLDYTHPEVSGAEWSLKLASGLNLGIKKVYASEEAVGESSSDLMIEPKIAKINELAAGLALEIDRPEQDAIFKFEGGRVTVFKPSGEGQSLDRAQTVELIANQLTDPDSERSIVLPVKLTQPKITTEKANDLGINKLLGRGVSNFAGSIPGRIYNIELASSKLTGIIIPPGEIFSFNQAVGEISAATGYKPAYVIQSGRTVLGDGGGVCQVSTTLFRAVLNAGLPIIKRYAHAYRVGYYEQGFPPGLDATVFAPSVDFQFKNDTPANVLIQTHFDRQNLQLVFELYGTDDGRKTYVSTPVVTNQSPPPTTLYQEDTTLPRGTVRQVDWSAWGASVSFNRKVTRGDHVLIDETFSSRYQSWRAVFLVGTRE